MAIAEIQGIISDPSKLKDIFGSTPILIDDIPVDVLMGETPVYAWDTPEHPVEAGLDITDSRYETPVSVTLDCIFTNPEVSVTNVLSSALQGENVFKQSLWYEKRDSLLELKALNKFIDVVTPNETYSSMMIVGIKPIYTKDRANSYSFQIDLKHIRAVTNDSIAVDDSQIPQKLKEKEDPSAKKKTAKKAKAGKKATQTASEKRQSILDKIVGQYL